MSELKKKNHFGTFKLIAITVMIFSFTILGCKTKKKGKTISGKSGTTADKKNKNSEETTNKANKNKSLDTKEHSKKEPENKTSNQEKVSVKNNGKVVKKVKNTKLLVKKKVVKLTKKQILDVRIKSGMKKAKSFLSKRGDKNLKSAIDAAKDVLKLDYQRFSAMLIIAEAEFKLGSYGKMAAALVRIRDLRNKMKPATKTSGKWHVFMGRYYLHRARDFEKKGFLLKALFQKALAKKEFSHPTTNSLAEAQFVRGSLFLEGGYFGKALNAFKTAEKIGDSKINSNWKFYLNYGVTYLYNKRYVEAEKKLKYCLRALNNRCYKCHFNLALIYSLWSELPKLGNYTTSDRAKLVIKHAVAYRNYQKSKRNYDKTLIEKLDKWISMAKDRK